jgi:hypothetical protein
VRFLGAGSDEVLALTTSTLNNGKVNVDGQTIRNGQFGYGLSPGSVLWKPIITVGVTRATALIESKIDLRANLLAANLVDDISVKII